MFAKNLVCNLLMKKKIVSSVSTLIILKLLINNNNCGIAQNIFSNVSSNVLRFHSFIEVWNRVCRVIKLCYFSTRAGEAIFKYLHVASLLLNASIYQLLHLALKISVYYRLHA